MRRKKEGEGGESEEGEKRRELIDILKRWWNENMLC